MHNFMHLETRAEPEDDPLALATAAVDEMRSAQTEHQTRADLAATRTWHAAGPNPISYAEIEAYARAQRLPLRPDHFATLRSMDETYIRAIAARQRDKASGVKTLPPKAPGSMSAGLFDAMFG